MIYFDRLFAIKQSYKAALDEDAQRRAKVEQDWHDGYVTDLYKSKALQELDAALEYNRDKTLEQAEAIKTEALSMFERFAALDASRLPANAAFFAENAPVTLTAQEVQNFVNENYYNTTATRAAREYANRRNMVTVVFPPAVDDRKKDFILFYDTITGAIQAGLMSGFYGVENADELLMNKIQQNPNLADLDAVAASVAAN